MNLTWMGVAALRELHGRIGTVIEACGPLERADLWPEISLGDEETVIRCGPMVDVGAELSVVEPIAAAQVEIVPAPVAASPAKTLEQVPARAADVVPEAPADLIEGPLSDHEKAEIEKLAARGVTSKAIGWRLGRKSQTIGLYLNTQARAAARAAEKQNDIPAGQPAEGQPVQANTPDATQDDVAKGAGPDAEEKGTEPTAKNAPVAGGASLSLPDAPEWGFAERRIVAHLNGLPRAFDWDLAGDLSMCQALARGDKLAMVALDMGKDAQWIKQRHAVVTETIRNSAGQVTVDGGAMLLRVLSTLVAGLKKGAA
jgi:hypothetical protein